MRLTLLLVLALVSAALGSLVTIAVPKVSAQASFVNPAQYRFRLVGDELVAGPDARSTVSGWKVVILRDMKSDQCYVAFVTGTAMSASGPTLCP